MKKTFIKLQLFGDPSGDPNAQAPNAAAGGAQTPGAVGDDATPNAAQELIEFKKNFVSREQYEKEKERADGYLAAILNNREDDVVAKEGEVIINPEDIAKEMFVEDNKMTDLEYCENALALRKARLAAGDKDPFLPDDPDDKDYEIAQNVADVFEDCIKGANGNNATFMALIQSRMKDTPILPNFKRR